MIREICCACQKVIRIRSDGTNTGRLDDSHGYCTPCLAIELGKVLAIKRDKQTNFARPVCVESLHRNNGASACAGIPPRESAGAATSAPAKLLTLEAA